MQHRDGTRASHDRGPTISTSPHNAEPDPPRRGPGVVEAPVDAQVAPRAAARFGSDRLVELLARLGVRYLPTNPGSSFRGLHDSVVNHGGNRDPQLLLCHNELIAVSLAHGYAKAAQRPGVAVVHDLVGLLQASMGVYNAWVDEVPLLLLGGGGPVDTTERRPIDWIHSASAQTQVVRDYVKWDAEPADQPATERAVADAYRRSSTPPAGPTYVTLDASVQERAISGATVEADPLALPPTIPTLAAADAERLAARLLRAESPAIVVGPLGYAAAATQAVMDLAEALGAPALDVDHAAVVPSESDLNLSGDHELLRSCDVILALGVRDLPAVVEEVLGRRRGSVLRPALPDAAVLDVGLRDLTMRGWSGGGRSSPSVDEAVLAEPTAAAVSLAAAAADVRPGEPVSRRRWRQERRERLATRSEQRRQDGRDEVAGNWNRIPISPGRLVAELWQAVAELPWQLAIRNTRSFPRGVWRFEDANDYLGHSGGGGVGYGPGAMVGAALGAFDTDRIGIGIIGDGDLLMHPGALWTAVHYRIPLLLVVNDNGSFHNDEDHQMAIAADRRRPTANASIGVGMSDPAIDIAALARSYGAFSLGPIEDPDELQGALTSAVEAVVGGEVAVVHARTSPR